MTSLPPQVLAGAEEVNGSSGAATGGVARLLCRTPAGECSIIRKSVRPLTGGRHAEASRDPRHWAYWRREPLAYASGLLPSGELRAPRCYGVVDDVIYLEDVPVVAESPVVAARRLARWQGAVPAPEGVPWLAGHQLAQRVAVTELDWGLVDADPRLASVWGRRFELLESLESVPLVISHGDFHPVNLVACGDSTVALDWGTFGVAPVGADLAHLALGAGRHLVSPYVAEGFFSEDAVRVGYSVTLVLTGVSRVHWMLSRGVPVPEGYLELVLGLAVGSHAGTSVDFSVDPASSR